MIEFVEERFEWIPGPQEFHRVEHDLDTLVHMRPLRPDVTRERVQTGWQLITSMPIEENAQLFVVDLWSRTTSV